MSAPLACALSWCRKSPARFFVVGTRCADHTPSAQAGVPEPDEQLARHRQTLARREGTDTTERNAA